MSDTIKSVLDEYKDKLCKVPIQDFETGAVLRDMQRALDPEGTKQLNQTQVDATKAFFDIMFRKAYR